MRTASLLNVRIRVVRSTKKVECANKKLLCTGLDLGPPYWFNERGDASWQIFLPSPSLKIAAAFMTLLYVYCPANPIKLMATAFVDYRHTWLRLQFL
jgi:hypothetical protein